VCGAGPLRSKENPPLLEETDAALLTNPNLVTNKVKIRVKMVERKKSD